MIKNNLQAEFREAIAQLASVARQHPESIAGQTVMAVITSIAFRVAVPIDLGEISAQFSHPDDALTLNAALTAIRARSWCEWPTDVVPGQEIHDWLSAGKVSYAA